MLDQLVQNLLTGDRHALARLFSLLERDTGQLPALMRALHPHTGGAYTIAVTGPPGAGKSTLVAGLTQVFRSRGSAVGILAVDPTSPFSGGAVLGDRIRMKDHFLDQGVFIRSLATRGAHGGLSRVTGAAVRLLDAYGKDVVVIESVGVGQTELEVMNLADTVVVVLVPEAGDAIQALKAGLIEIADILVINKADREGADRLAAAIGAEVRDSRTEEWWTPPVLLTQAHKGEGIASVHQAILDHRHSSEKTSHLQRRRARRRRLEFEQVLRESIEARIADLEMHGDELGDILARVQRGDIDPYSAAAEVLVGGEFLTRLATSLSPHTSTSQSDASQ